MSTTVTRSDVSTAERARLLRARGYQGIFARVAKRLGKTRQHVYMVAVGKRQSRPVLNALLSEIARLDARIEQLKKVAA